jgi:hypothetical protein
LASRRVGDVRLRECGECAEHHQHRNTGLHKMDGCAPGTASMIQVHFFLLRRRNAGDPAPWRSHRP